MHRSAKRTAERNRLEKPNFFTRSTGLSTQYPADGIARTASPSARAARSTSLCHGRSGTMRPAAAVRAATRTADGPARRVDHSCAGLAFQFLPLRPPPFLEPEQDD